MMQPSEPNPSQRAVLQSTTRVVYYSRRRVATALAIGLAVIFGYHAIFGRNGITAYAEKRSEDRKLTTQIEKLKDENAQLKDHVDHLQNDPDTIEREARERLHYTRPGEVIYTLENRAEPPAASASSRPGGSKDAPLPPAH